MSASRRRWLVGFTGALCLTPPPPTTAQTVRGRVTEQRHGTPLPHGRIELLTDRGAVAARGRTGGDGTYELGAPSPGTYRIRIEEPNHRPVLSDPFILNQGDSVEVSPVLSPLPHLEGFYRRRDLAGGGFVALNEAQGNPPIRVTELIRGLGGFTCTPDDVGSCRLSSARSWQTICPPLVLVDELRMGTTLEYDLDLMSPLWLGAIEVYASPSTMPPELKVFGATCGLILLWTRR